MSGIAAVVLGGCPGDRAMFVNVSTHVLDVNGRPVAGETVGVIPSDEYRWPRPPKDSRDVTPIDPAKYGEVHHTDPNGHIEFVATNTEPVEVFTSIFRDMLFPPSIRFLMMLPDRTPSAYAVTFRPGDGEFEKDRVTYRHFDLKAGRTLPATYSDDTGGLAIAVDRPTRNPNNRWGGPGPSLRIKILAR
jgi:hypothetical protein